MKGAPILVIIASHHRCYYFNVYVHGQGMGTGA